MTENGTLHHQRHRAGGGEPVASVAGLFIDHDRAKIHSSGKIIYSARLIPLRGSWIDFEFDPKDILYVRHRPRRKFPHHSAQGPGLLHGRAAQLLLQDRARFLEGESISPR